MYKSMSAFEKVFDADFQSVMRDVGFKETPRETFTIKEVEEQHLSMKEDVGDWIIKGLKGEFYPCKPDVFEMKYKQVIEA